LAVQNTITFFSGGVKAIPRTALLLSKISKGVTVNNYFSDKPKFVISRQTILFSFSDPPEIEIEQTWYQPNGEKSVEVELLCTVHANPEAEVKK
jgi:hypothetical protein